MSSEIAIHAQDLSKTFQLYDRPIDRLKQMIARKNRRYYKEFAALEGISFTLKKGEVLGLVGSNGAGKSTLLQLICGTLTPSSGRVNVTGRVAALLELGAGFNPDFTGKENIYLNASILGLDKSEIDDRYEAIVDFSGIGDFIDQPVKTYSSGMYVRLAFSIATSVDPDILVIDEALSVGDGAFARKSFDRILNLRSTGTTILFCSHSSYQIESLCTSAIWLDHGRIKRIGAPGEVTAAYQEHIDQLSAPPVDASHSQAMAPAVTSPGQARIRALHFSCDGKQGTTGHAVSGVSDIEVKISFDSDPMLDVPHAAITINTADGRILASSGTAIDGIVLKRDARGQGNAIVRFPAISLLKGRYSLSAYLFCERGLYIYSAAEKFAALTIEQTHLEQGVVSLPHTWAAKTGFAVIDASADVAEFTNLPLVLPLDWTPRFTTQWACPNDEEGLLELFAKAFGKQMSTAQWRWKYQHAVIWGTVVKQDIACAAFFGGMPRIMAHAGKRLQAIQIGDVMVAPAYRGTLARTGPLFRSAYAYFENMHQLYSGVQFAFGFPSLRHIQIGLKLGLYREVDSFSTLIWDAIPPARSIFFKTRELHNLTSRVNSVQLNKLWSDMQQDWAEMFIPVRDGDRWNYRYTEHPENEYKIFLIKNRWTGRPLSAVVVKIHSDYLEWIDYVGSRANIKVAIKIVRTHAGKLKLPFVRGWFSSKLIEEFIHGSVAVEATEIRVPINQSKQTETLSPALWLMAGDTDFR